jgi:hypothetical protein
VNSNPRHSIFNRVANCPFDSAEYGFDGSATKLAELSFLQLPQRQTRWAEPLLFEIFRVSWRNEMESSIIMEWICVPIFSTWHTSCAPRDNYCRQPARGIQNTRRDVVTEYHFEEVLEIITRRGQICYVFQLSFDFQFQELFRINIWRSFRRSERDLRPWLDDVLIFQVQAHESVSLNDQNLLLFASFHFRSQFYNCLTSSKLPTSTCGCFRHVDAVYLQWWLSGNSMPLRKCLCEKRYPRRRNRMTKKYSSTFSRMED